MFQPCLHGGTSYNIKPGYYCVCGPTYTGDNCKWAKHPPGMQPLTAPMAIAALTLSILLIGTKHLVTALRPSTSGEEAIRVVSPLVPGRTIHFISSEEDKCQLKTNTRRCSMVAAATATRGVVLEHQASILANPQRCSIAAVTATTDGLVLEHRRSISHMICSLKTSTTAVCPATTNGVQQVIISPAVRSAPPLLAQDDLRAYAYEGEGSPSGSFTSTISGLQRDLLENSSLRPVVPEYNEVLNLLKNLPNAVNLSTLSQENMEKVTKVEKFVIGSKSPKAKQAGSDIT